MNHATSTHHRKCERGVLKFGGFEDWERGEGDGECGGDLREAATAQIAGHQSADHDHQRLREDRKHPQADHRNPKRLSPMRSMNGVSGG